MTTKTSLLSVTTLLAIFALAACSTSTEEPRTDVKSTQSASATDTEEELNDRIYCKVDKDCDSDETCVNGKCAGLDGDTE